MVGNIARSDQRKDYVIANAGPVEHRAILGDSKQRRKHPQRAVRERHADRRPGERPRASSNIEAEDFNFESGKTKPAASVMPYVGDAYNGLDAVF